MKIAIDARREVRSRSLSERGEAQREIGSGDPLGQTIDRPAHVQEVVTFFARREAETCLERFPREGLDREHHA